MVSTGGGDSLLLMCAVPLLLLVGHLSRGEGDVDLTLPIWWKTQKWEMLFVRQALKNLLVGRALGGVAHVSYFCMPAIAVF